MTRYFFHCADSPRHFDVDGVELEDLRAAHSEAVRWMGELLTEFPHDFWSKGHLAILVTDAAWNLLFSVTTIAAEPQGAFNLLDTNA